MLKNNINLIKKYNLNINNSNSNKINEINDNDNNNNKNVLNTKNLCKETIKAIDLFKKNGYNLSNNDIEIIDSYINSGDRGKKLISIEIAIDKSLPIDKNMFTNIEISEIMSLLDFLPITPSPEQNNNLINSNNIENKIKFIEKQLFKIIDDIDNNSLKNEDFNNNLDYDKNIKNKIKKAIKDWNEFDNSDVLIQNSLYNQSNIKIILEEKITENIIKIKNDFKNFKKDINNDFNKLNNIETKFDKVNTLKNIIEKLDKFIMKSDVMNYLDLKTEKNIIKLSSNLNDALIHLENNEFSNAKEIVTNVIKELNNINFNPSIKKITATNITYNIDENYSFDNIMNQTNENISNFTNNQKSVSSIIAFMKSLGINNEAEVFQNIFENSNISNLNSKSDKENINLKSILLNLSKIDSNNNSKIQATNAISMINGNQIKQSNNNSKDIQNISFNIPIKFNNTTTNVKVYLKAPQKNLKLDIKNFNMYFVLNTNKYNEIGIKINCINSEININIKNNKLYDKDIKNTFKDYFKNSLNDIGYKLNNFDITKFDEENNLNNSTPTNNSNDLNEFLNSNDFDIKI